MDGLLGMLGSAWQAILGVCVLLVVVAAGSRLIVRAPSRMGRALLVSGLAIVVVVLLGIAVAVWSAH